MQLKRPSDFDLTVDRLKSLFKDFQLSLNELKESPLLLNSDQPHFIMWMSNKWIKTLFNVLCLPIDSKLDASIKPEDLEEFNFNPGECKIEHDDEE